MKEEWKQALPGLLMLIALLFIAVVIVFFMIGIPPYMVW